jgi:hypothetical protein
MINISYTRDVNLFYRKMYYYDLRITMYKHYGNNDKTYFIYKRDFNHSDITTMKHEDLDNIGALARAYRKYMLSMEDDFLIDGRVDRRETKND